ncbi:MAG: TonB-dependent receptor [Chitinophagaceae bacterium]|nr:MAG: TonB-dependent receptor [Chitinophagaceae bacterium]
MSARLHPQQLLHDGRQRPSAPSKPAVLPNPAKSLKTTFFLLLSLLTTTLIQAQGGRSVTGTVTDVNGVPLNGATVVVKGSTGGTSTGQNGVFQINVNSDADSLVFSAIGYQTLTQVVGPNTILVISLQNQALTSMDAVTVVGFGRQRRISVVGAQSTIAPAELKMPVANISTLLAGRVAGVVGVQRSGEPGRDGADIWIRGIATTGSSAPLVLVDGVARSISNIDPEDIESFTIIKDAAGSAVYGARGANGVVIVVTKKGKIGSPQVSLDYNEGFTTFTVRPKMLDGVTYMNLVNEALTTRGETPKYTTDYINNTAAGTDPLLYPNVDWMKEVFNDYGRNRRINLNVNGGSDRSQYYVSLAYYDESGFLKTDGLENYNSSLKYTRYNFTSNLTVKVTNTTKMELGLQGYVSNGNYPGENTEDIFGSALDIPPVEYPKMYPGNFIPGRSSNGGLRNPYADLTRRGYRTEFRNQVYSNLRLTQDLSFITKGLNITGMFSFDAYNEMTTKRSKREATYFINQTDPYNADGTLNLDRTFAGDGNFLGYERGNGGRRQFYTEASANWERVYNGKHRLGAMALFYAEDRMNNFAGDFTASIPERQVGLASRITYSYDDRYFAEVNGGYNGSETFAPDNRFGFFPAFGIGWVPSNENFFEPVKNVISFLKFRYTDGNTGIGTIEGRRFAYLTLLTDQNVPGYALGDNFNNTGGILISDYGVDITWAESRKQDLGMELHLFKDKLNLTVDLFKEHRTGIFLQRQTVPNYLGLRNSPFGNLGEVNNKGFDGNLNFTTQIGKDWTIGLLANATFNKDVVVEDDRPDQPYPWLDRRGNNILSRYAYQAVGLFTSQEEIDNSAVPGDRSSIRTGDIRYADLNNDGLINNNDMTRVGRGDVPSFVYGFGTNIGYKNFGLNVLFQGISNADIMLGGSAIIPFNGNGGISNAYSIATDRWTEDKQNQDVFYPRLGYGEAQNRNNSLESSWWVKDVSFMRLKAAELNYNFPASIYKKAGLKGASVYLIGTNLLTFSKFKIWDPELNTGGRADGSRYPNVRVISIGVNAKF